MIKKLGLLLVFVVLLSACAPLAVAPKENILPSMPVNDLEGGRLERSHVFPEENLRITTEYASGYSTNRWRVTDSKILNIRLKMESLEEKTGGSTEVVTVLVEHMHADIALKACCVGNSATLDGWTVDTMDDSIHGGSQPGFVVTKDHPYEEAFAIEGFSETLIEGWGYFTDAWGWETVNQRRLDEDRLVNTGGIYAQKFQVIFDVLIKIPDDGYYKKIIVDEFLVPVAGGEKWAEK